MITRRTETQMPISSASPTVARMQFLGRDAACFDRQPNSSTECDSELPARCCRAYEAGLQAAACTEAAMPTTQRVLLKMALPFSSRRLLSDAIRSSSSRLWLARYVVTGGVLYRASSGMQEKDARKTAHRFLCACESISTPCTYSLRGPALPPTGWQIAEVQKCGAKATVRSIVESRR